MIDIQKHIIPNTYTAKQTLNHLNDVGNLPILFVVNEKEECVGSITDGDLRRFMVADGDLSESILNIANKNFDFLNDTNNSIEHIKKIRNKRLIPLLDSSNKILKIIDFKDQKSFLPCSALIMAGGKGTRLMPLTEKTPKPLIEVGDTAILDITISRLINFGVQNIYISIHHMKEQIIEYVDAKNYDATIHYVEENEPSGTLGAIKFMGEWKYDHLLVMNCDLLTNVNFESFLEDTIKANAKMSVVTIPYKVAIPYAVLENEGGYVTGLKEKPTISYQTNAGIYFVNKSALKHYDGRIPYNSPDLMETLIDEKEKVRSYSFSGYWLDIGKHQDLDQAQQDIKSINLF